MEVSYIGKENFMNFKRILVLVMTFAMLLSTFAPTLGVFAEELQNQTKGTNTPGNKDTLEYVSIGDSMTNGIGMDGYDATGKNGYLEEAPDAYPSQFAGWLESFTGKEVNLTQLATSAARIEDVYYLLTKGTEKEFTPDFWTVRELLTNPDRWGKTGAPRGEENWDKHMDTNNTIANVFQSSVANADVISLATGNGNFGVFFMGRVMNLVGFGSAEELALDNEKYAHMTVANALELCEANEEVKELVMDVYNEAEAYLVEAGMPSDLIVAILNYLVYTTASYVVTYMNMIDYIAAVNPDATVMILPLINNGLDFNFDITLNGITKSFNAGDFLGALYTPINAFMAAYTAVANETGASDNTYYYAELPVDENGETIQVETFAQAFETLYAPIVDTNNNGVIDDEDYPADKEKSSRLFCHNRFYGEIQTFVMPIILGGTEDDYDGKFNEYDIRAYEIAKANGTASFAAYAAANADKVELISYYLGIVDAVLYAMSVTPNANIDEITVPEGEEFSMFALLGPIVGDLGTTVYNKVQANANAISGSLYNDLVAAQVVPGVSPYFADPTLVELFGIDVEATDLENTLYIIGLARNNNPKFEYTPELQGMKAQLVNAHNQIMDGVPALAMATVLPETLSAELTNVGLLEALLALYGRLKLAWGLSAHPSAAGHDTLTQSLINAYENEYTTKDETIANIKETIDLAIKVTDEAYQKAYDKVDNAGYINKVVSLLNRVINRLQIVDLSDNTMTEEFRVLLDKEIEATIATLKEIKDVLANDKAEDLEGLVATLRGLKGDVLTHTKNIYALCAQAGIDVNQLVIIPALNEALNILETEVVPALEELAEALVEALVAHVLEKAEELYNAAYEAALGLSKEVYLQLVELLVKVELHVKENAEAIVNAVTEQLFALAAVLEEAYGDAKVAVGKALEVVIGLVEKVLEAKDNIEEAIDLVLNTYPVLLEKLYDALGDIEAALKVADKVIGYVIYRVTDVVVDVNDIAVLLNDIVTITYEILVDAGVPVEDAMELAGIICGEVVDVLLDKVDVDAIVENLNGLLDNALNTLLNSGLTYEQAAALAAGALTTVVTAIVKHFDDVDNALNFTKAVLQTVYDYLVENRVEITEALKIALDVAKAVVVAVVEGVEALEDAIAVAEKLLETVYNFLVETGLDVETALKMAMEVGFAALLQLVGEANDVLANVVKALVASAMELLVNAGYTVEKALAVVVESLKAVLAGLVEDAKDLLDEIAKGALEAVFALLVEAGMAAEEALKIALNALNEVLVALVGEAKDALDALAMGVLEAAYALLLEAGMAVEEALKTAMEYCYDMLVALVGEAKDAVVEIATGMLKAAYACLLEAGLTVQEALAVVADITNDVLTTVYNFLLANGEAIADAVKLTAGIVKEVVEFVVANAEDITEALVFAGEVAKLLYNFLVVMGVDVKEAAKLTVEVLKNVIKYVVENFEDVKAATALTILVIKDVYNFLVEMGVDVDTALRLVLEIAKEVIWFALNNPEDVKNALEYANEVLKSVYDFLVENGADIKEALELTVEIAKDVIKFVMETADDIKDALEFANNVFYSVYNFLVENGEEIENAFNTALEVYEAVVEILVAAAETFEKAIEIAVGAFEFVLEVAQLVCDTAEEIFAFATDVYATLVEVAVKIHNVVDVTIDVYNYVYNLLVDVFGSIENAACLATKICKLVVEYIQNTPELLEGAYKLYCDIYDLIVEVYGETGDVYATANAVYTYVVGLIKVAFEDFKASINGATNGNYVITENSFYLALGNAEYAKELAEMLFLGDKYAQFGLAEDYLEALAKADLVTVKFNNGEFYGFAYKQILGTVATLVRSNELFMQYYGIYSSILAPVLAQYNLDINAEADELDWSKYIDEETLAILNQRLDKLAADLVAAGIPEVYSLDLTPVIAEQLPSGFDIDSVVIDIPVAELIAFAIENALYVYAETAARVANTLGTIYEVAPNATVVVTGINNPLAPYADLIGQLAPDAVQYLDVLDDVVEFLNVPLYFAAVANKNTIFVESEDALAIYEALNVRCGHAYDNACDTTCNICGETREVPAHVYDNACDATCNVCGATRTVADHVYDNACDATCNVCGATRTPAAHVYDNACDATCNVCGATRIPADHVYDNACDTTCNVCGAVREVPAHNYVKGVCSECGAKDPDYKEPLGTGLIIVIAVGSVAVACGAGAAVYWFFLKRKDI